MLREHAGRKIRAIGRLHSWSEAPLCPEVLVDLRHIAQVDVHADEEPPWAEIGAGCQIREIVSVLERAGWTLPSLGLIMEQALAGAIATGTHGSGRPSLSHYVQSAKVATYDPTSRAPVVRTIEAGDELRAVRCALGCLGILTSIRLPIRPQYYVEEHVKRFDELDDVLTAESEFELQQFFWLPWRWDFFAQRRREVDPPRSRLAPLYRLYWSVGMDVVFHWAILALARWLPRRCSPWFYRWLVPLLIPRGWKVADRSDRQLTMQHQRFRHVEIEIFVRRSRLADAVKYVRWLLERAAGSPAPMTEELKTMLHAQSLEKRFHELEGRYCHHYPICIRKVLPDDTLISMASGEEPSYALSFISYARPAERDGFLAFAEVLARSTAAMFQARPHWGKLCPLAPAVLESLYPDFNRFREVVRAFDPDNVFGNAWTTRLFGEADSRPAD